MISNTNLTVEIDGVFPEIKRNRTHTRSSMLAYISSLDELLLFDPSDVDFSSLVFLNAPQPSPVSVDSKPHPTVLHRFLFLLAVTFEASLLIPNPIFSTLLQVPEGGKYIIVGVIPWMELQVRVLANRQSAAKSKERKIRYTEQNLHRFKYVLFVYTVQRGASDLTIENKHLKMRLQAFNQQAELRDPLSEALREELNQLKKAAGEIPQGNGNSYNRAQFSSQQSTMNQLGNNKNKQMSTNGRQPSRPSFVDFTKRG
ncbi:hypothetical protein N665_0752s0002 [Sinapis alba]|nr:hypothetical protein N665_0752s0002 [Sinapis alba]